MLQVLLQHDMPRKMEAWEDFPFLGRKRAQEAERGAEKGEEGQGGERGGEAMVGM